MEKVSDSIRQKVWLCSRVLQSSLLIRQEVHRHYRIRTSLCSRTSMIGPLRCLDTAAPGGVAVDDLVSYNGGDLF